MKKLEIQKVENRLENIRGRIAVLQSMFYPDELTISSEEKRGIETMFDDIQSELEDSLKILESNKIESPVFPGNLAVFPVKPNGNGKRTFDFSERESA